MGAGARILWGRAFRQREGERKALGGVGMNEQMSGWGGCIRIRVPAW